MALLILAVAACGQTAAPSFRADRVLAFDVDQPLPLSPGMILSIYGANLGPQVGCEATQGYPTELCGVRVLVADKPVLLMYVQAKQINFKVPQDAPLEGKASLRVVYQKQSSASVEVSLGLKSPKLTLEGTARVGSPIWVDVELPFGTEFRWGQVIYPVSSYPDDFGCNRLEVRQNGVALAPMELSILPGRIGPGNGCGNDLVMPKQAAVHPGRLPLHLRYKFENPGLYEVRYTRLRSIFESEVRLQSDWTPIHVLAAQPAARPARPQDPAEILSDYLPGILASPDAASLATVSGYLYDRNEKVRFYAAMSLGYWPRAQVVALLAELIRTKGPSDVMVNLGIPLTPDLLDPMLPYLRSDDQVLLTGSIRGILWILSTQHTADANTETALVAAIPHVLRSGDRASLQYLAEAFGALHGEASRQALWDFVERGVSPEQSLIAITWRKDPRDLPRLGALLEAPDAGDPQGRIVASLAYSLRNAFGEAAIPYLEAGLKNSLFIWVQTSCARELVLAGRPAGFAFIAQAMEQGRRYKGELIQFLRDQFPELKSVDEAAILTFVQHRAG